MPAVRFDCLDIRDGGSIKKLVIAHIGAIARSDSVLLLHATIFLVRGTTFGSLGCTGDGAR